MSYTYNHNYPYTTTSKSSNYNSDTFYDKNSSFSSPNSSKFDSATNDSHSTSFLRSTMGSQRQRQSFDLSGLQNEKKTDFSLRNTTGNLAGLLKKLDFDKQLKQKEPIESKKYSDLNVTPNSFKKQKSSANIYESKPIGKYDKIHEKSHRQSVKEMIAIYDREQQLKKQLEKLKQQKQQKNRARNNSTSLTNLLTTTNITESSSFSSTSGLSKNPQDLYQKVRKGSNDSTTFDKKYEYDFSKKSIQDPVTKKIQFSDKKYEPSGKKQYEWKKLIQDPSSSSNNLKQEKKPSFLTSKDLTKSPIRKQDPLNKYFSTSQKSLQKFENKTSLRDFILGKALGQGKFGVVYQATHKPTKSLYALKKVPKSIIKSHYMIDQFILEIKLQAFMNHENLLSLHGFFHDSDHIYLILDYMQEGTLYSLLKKNKKLELSDAAKKIKQISKGIIYMHENGIAHRDLKPENVVMSYGSCKLCDFGWSTICDERRKTYCGTFDYAAPEILEGTEYDMSVDLWCLGVLAYQLLVGKAPFYHIKKEQTKKRILNVQSQPIVFPSDMPKNAIDFIDRLLKKDPQQRIKIDELLAHPFLAI